MGLAWACFSLPAKSAENPYWANLNTKLEKYLSANLDTKLYSYEITPPEMNDYLGKSPDAVIDFSGLVASSRQHLRTITASSRNPAEQLRINLKIWSHMDAWVADADIPAGSPIITVHRERVRVMPSDTQLVVDANKVPLENIKSKIANHRIAKGETVKINAFKSSKLISLGDHVTMVSESALIKLEFKCKAMGAGDIGDEITLNCPDLTKKSPKAEITGANLARLK